MDLVEDMVRLFHSIIIWMITLGGVSSEHIHKWVFFLFQAVLWIRIRRIRMFFGLLDPDPLVWDMDPDPDPSIAKQK
jgi:hypothetical protein